jgi:ParB-like chromosome segregation protein Spo0J
MIIWEFPISQLIDKSDRHTISKHKLDKMIKEVKKFGGIIVPILVTKEYQIIDGSLRLAAMKKLGHTTIPIQYRDEIE